MPEAVSRGGEETGGAGTPVVVSGPLGGARQHRLGAVERLDLGLLIHAQHQGALGRVEVETDDVADLLHEQWVGGELEGLGAMRLQAEGAPDPRDRGLGEPGLAGHRTG